ncbi:hypothetical protein AUJ14_02540 [Candidatus Micrarchaeota archaeon CG1_02_55_22]|nr:MAG: hypothetical protein AUJ14_02540 [Candidatus Micrarchaeota archaeon CG1_02_55_22]
MELELPYGPWTQLVNARWRDYPVGIYMNADKVLMLVLYEKHGDDVTGMLVALKKVFVVDNDLNKAVQSQQREITLIQKYSNQDSTRFVMLGGTPTYVKYSQEALVEAIGKQFSELKSLTKYIEDMGAAYKTHVKELAEASPSEIDSFLGDPFSLFSMVNPNAIRHGEEKSTVKLQVGLDSTDAPVVLPLEALSGAVVLGGSKQERVNAAQVLLETALTSSIPIVLFDSTGAFSGLGAPNPETSEFSKHKMTAMPLGFPMKRFKLGNGLYIDLQHVTKEVFLEAFGLEETDVGNLIASSWDNTPEKHVLGDVAAAVDDVTGKSHEATKYAAAKAARLLKVIGKCYPAIFNKNAASELMVPWHEGIGKVFYVDVTGYPENVKHLLVSSLLKAIPVPTGRKIKVVIGFDSDMHEIFGDVLELLVKLRGNSTGFVLNAEHEIDAELIQNPGVRIQLVGREAVATMNKEKPLRFKWRPTYTRPFTAPPQNEA